jgi:hypothetical protein
LDANVEIPLRVVDPVGNAHRHRNTSQPPAVEKPKTGLNAPDLILENMIRPDPAQPQNPATNEKNGGDENE